MESKSSGLLLFDEQDIQTDIIGSSTVDYHPVTSLTSGGPIEFVVPGTSDEYIDMSEINLEITVKVQKVAAGKNADLVDADKVAIINQSLSSLFQDVYLSIANKQVEGGTHLYPYSAYISSLLQFHPSAKKTHMQVYGWNEDEPGKMDDENEGFKFRSKAIVNGNSWNMYGPLYLDMTRQGKYLPPLTDLSFKFTRAKKEFALHQLSTATAVDCNITFSECVLWVRRVKVNELVIAQHNKGLESHNAIYNLQHIETSTFTIPSGQRTVRKDRLFMSQCPKTVVFGLVDHEAFNGKLTLNPFNFEHFNLTRIALYRDGELTPGHSFTTDYQKGLYARAYANSQQCFDFFNSDDSNGLTMEHFEKGYNLYPFNLAPDGINDSTHRSPNSYTSLRLEIDFGKALTKPINVIVFAVFDGKLEITKLRDIVSSYSR